MYEVIGNPVMTQCSGNSVLGFTEHQTGSSYYPGGGGDFIPSLPGCVCPKVMDMGPFLASSE